MIQFSKQVAEQNEKLDKIILEISTMISENSIIPDYLKFSVHELTDGFVSSDSILSELFCNEVNRKFSKKFIQFNSIPITNSIENYEEPLILIADEQELDTTTCDIVRERAEKGYITFPVIIFSDSFFKLAYGESCSYSSVIDIFEDSVKEKVMVFKKSEFKYIDNYIIYIINLYKIYICMSKIEELNNFFYDEIAVNTDKVEKSSDAISTLILINKVRAIQQLCVETERLQSRLESQTEIWNAEILKIREECDIEVLKSINHKDADKLSPFAVNIDLKYGKLQEYICDFLNSDILKKNYGFLTDELKDLMGNTRSSIEHNTARLSLIGTFSSGKTTLINTFLGKRDVPLRTSMGHNTAVLMHLFYEPTDKEYYDIVYKEKLVWTVVKPASMEKAAVNKEDSKIRIVSVETHRNGHFLVKYSVLKTKETHTLRIRTTSSLAVKKGDILNPGDPFTKMAQQISKNVEICSIGEIRLLIQLVSGSTAPKMMTRDKKSDYSGNQIINILKAIEKIAKEKNSTIPYTKLCETLGIKPKINAITKKEELTENFRRIEVECQLKHENERKNLDKNGWIELCGVPDSKSEQTSVFSEQPECYMLAKELQLHVNAEFLQYCSLTDTPGFGSVTEEHDAITERYIRDSTGRLLVMIAVNAKTMDAKYQDLINSIADIYNNFRSADKKNVVFILNCFNNLTSSEGIKKHVKDVSNMLVRYGFSKNNIYVCNLRDALENKQQTETMFGFPSYKKFHDFIIQEMISSDLTKKYRGIKQNWDMFLSDANRRVDSQIYDYENALNDAQKYKKSIQNSINSVKKVDISECEYDYTDIQDVFQDALDLLLDAYINNRKGIFESIRWGAICKALEDINKSISLKNEEIIEEIYDYYESCVNKISYYGNSELSEPCLPERTTPVVVLDSQSLKSLLSEADDETHWYNKGDKTSLYSDKIKDKIQAGLDQSREKADDYCYECYQVVNIYKEHTIHEKESILKNLKNEADIQKALQELNIIKKNIREIEEQFKVIRFV